MSTNEMEEMSSEKGSLSEEESSSSSEDSGSTTEKEVSYWQDAPSGGDNKLTLLYAVNSSSRTELELFLQEIIQNPKKSRGIIDFEWIMGSA